MQLAGGMSRRMNVEVHVQLLPQEGAACTLMDRHTLPVSEQMWCASQDGHRVCTRTSVEHDTSAACQCREKCWLPCILSGKTAVMSLSSLHVMRRLSAIIWLLLAMLTFG